MSETSLIPIATKAKVDQALEYLSGIVEITKISTETEYSTAVEIAKKTRKYYNDLEADRKELASPHYNKFKNINGEFNPTLDKLKKIRITFDNAITKHFIEKEQMRIAAQKRVDAEVEERRRQEEAKAQREVEKEQTYREQNRPEMADKAQARAETAQTVANSIVAPLAQNAAKVKGTSFTKKYKAELTDKRAAIEHMLMNNILIQYLSVDLKGIERLAKAQKGTLEIEGIRIAEDYSTSISQ